MTFRLGEWRRRLSGTFRHRDDSETEEDPPTDPVAFAGAGGLLILLALLAAYVPSRRAARLSPVETLRCE